MHSHYKTIKKMPIEELSLELHLLEHSCGAQVLHLASEDEENLFSLSFKTHPTSSNGVAHILEHTVLCGSEKYPVKDPFFAMIRRSLNTFMNAMTGADFTCYPAASQVEKDFYNLLDIYIDAVFHPKLKELSFRQEGHRLDFEGDALTFKGIVFNEMKGYMNSADGRVWHKLMELLLPDTTYAFDSGGDPKVIPELTYEQFLDFHKQFYHPSRCLFFFHGNLDLDQHLDYLHERILSGAERLEPVAPIAAQKRFEMPVKECSRYPSSDEDLSKKTFVSFAWLTCSAKEQEELLALSLVETLLMEHDASPLKFALLNSGLCLQADSHLDGEMSEAPFVLICRGCEEKDADAIEALVDKTLREVRFDEEMIEAALHQIELARLEITGDHSPYGLTLFFRAALAMQHGAEPEEMLKIHSLFDTLREKLEDPSYLNGLIEKYLLNNSHRVRLVTRPDHNLEQEEIDEEKGRLHEIEESLSDEQKGEIRKQAKELDAFQKDLENHSLDCLPKLDLEDIPKKTKDYPLVECTHEGLLSYHHPCFANQLVYPMITFPLPKVDVSELQDLSLLLSLITEVGAGKYPYQEMLGRQQACSGGIHASIALNVQSGSPQELRPRIQFSGKGLQRKGDELIALLTETFTAPRFDELGRVKELILQIYTSLNERIKRKPLGFAIQRSLSGFSSHGLISNEMYGLPFFNYIEDLCKDLDAQLPAKLESLKILSEKVLHLSDPHLVLSGEGAPHFSPTWESKNYTPWSSDFALEMPSHAGRAIPSQVAFTCQAFQTVGFEHPLSAALTICSELFEHKVLHPVIREQGGAYGGRCAYQPLTGMLYFYSYQDPHLSRTLAAFVQAIDEISAGNFSEDDLEEAKLSYIQEVDSPTAPGSRAAVAYGWMMRGRTLERRQEQRERTLALQKSDVIAASQMLREQLEKSVITSFAGKKLLSKENTELNQPLIMI
ncbi:MAG: insulinase family protein [Simkaniaceae bacterium]|nr:insulinase family protein [Simkaniaceae bacterium]